MEQMGGMLRILMADSNSYKKTNWEISVSLEFGTHSF